MNLKLEKPSRPGLDIEGSLSLDSFAALDFETADYGAESACAVGLVKVSQGRIVERFYRLIRPPRREFVFTYIHGITWERVEREKTFEEVWPDMERILRSVEWIAAHNAGFDSKVLQACCEGAAVERPNLPFLCTVRLARDRWGIRPTNLANVCRVLSIPLNHHQALSDAEACARIVIEAGKAVRGRRRSLDPSLSVRDAALGSHSHG